MNNQQYDPEILRKRGITEDQYNNIKRVARTWKPSDKTDTCKVEPKKNETVKRG